LPLTGMPSLFMAGSKRQPAPDQDQAGVAVPFDRSVSSGGT
jgi:hypothetical protein